MNDDAVCGDPGPLLVVRFVPLHPLRDCTARGSEDLRDKGRILSIGEMAPDHGSANAFRMLGISGALIG